MADFYFNERFVQAIEEGTKIQTVRKDKRCDVGDTVNLLAGKDTLDERIISIRKCKMVVPVVLTEAGVQVAMPGCQVFMAATKKAAGDFAIASGFTDYFDMFDWFAAEYDCSKFYGFAHRWEA